VISIPVCAFGESRQHACPKVDISDFNQTEISATACQLNERCGMSLDTLAALEAQRKTRFPRKLILQFNNCTPQLAGSEFIELFKNMPLKCAILI
jgi:hypothetical protein